MTIWAFEISFSSKTDCSTRSTVYNIMAGGRGDELPVSLRDVFMLDRTIASAHFGKAWEGIVDAHARLYHVPRQ